MIVWVIGISGAGKTTIGRCLYKRLKKSNPCTIFLDGDDLRNIMDNDLGHTHKDREIQAARFSRLCYLMDQNDIDVVCAALSNYPQWQSWNRSNFGAYREIYLDVTLDTVVRRDPKGIYAAALAGNLKNIVGMDVEFFPPENPDLVMDNNHDQTDVTEIANTIFHSLRLG